MAFSRLMNFYVVKVEAVELVLALDGVLEQGLAVNTAILESHFKVQIKLHSPRIYQRVTKKLTHLCDTSSSFIKSRKIGSHLKIRCKRCF